LDRRLLVNETRESVLSPILSVIKKLESEDEKFKAEAKFSEGEEKCYTGSVIEAERFFPGWVYDEKEKFVDEVYQQLLAINPLTQLSHYSFCTNGSHFAGELNIPTIGYGPSAENLAHIDNEYIEIEQLTRVTEGYIAIMRTLTSQAIIKKEDESNV
jgi:acetylornithine deacetylase/succinyl-diaminopimelate desuccinylase-like protein